MGGSVALFSLEYPIPNAVVTDLGYLVAAVANGLRAMGLGVHVVMPGDRDEVDRVFGVDVVKIGLGVKDYPDVVSYGLSIPAQVMRRLPYLVRERVSVVHGFEWSGCLMALATKALLGDYKLVCSVLSTEYERGDPRSSSLSASIASIEEYAFSQSDALLAHSKSAYASLSSNYTIKAPIMAANSPFDKILEVYS